MKGGVLEVLLVNASGLKHSHFIAVGCPGLYAIVQCGAETYRGKITSGKDERVWWNEKFVFKFTSLEWRSLNRLSVKIMKKDKFTEDSFIGETIIHLEGIIKEGSHKRCIDVKPAPYNVVLSDGTYEGKVKIGLKFMPNVELQWETRRRERVTSEVTEPRTLYRTIFNFTFRRIRWSSFLFFRRRENLEEAKANK